MKSLQSTRADLATATSSHSRETGSEIQRLRSESASKDLEILNLLRRKAELKEDREMLNIALDSKQQELELVCRPPSVYPPPDELMIHRLSGGLLSEVLRDPPRSPNRAKPISMGRSARLRRTKFWTAVIEGDPR